MAAARAHTVKGRVAAIVLIALAGSRAAAAGDACPAGDEPAAGPLPGGTGPADFGAVPEACGATDAALRLRGAALIASGMPDYFGSGFGSATLRGRYQLGERTFLSGAADVFVYRYVDDATLASHGPSVGPATLAFHHTFLLGATTATALYARLLLPLDSARQSGVETGLELGGGLRVPVGRRVVVDGGVALAAPIDVVAGQAHLRLQPDLLAEAWLRVRPWLALGAGADLRAVAAPSFDLVTVAPRLGARFALRRRVWTAVLVEVPAAGSDRTDLIAGLFVGIEP